MRRSRDRFGTRLTVWEQDLDSLNIQHCKKITTQYFGNVLSTVSLQHSSPPLISHINKEGMASHSLCRNRSTATWESLPRLQIT